MGGGVVLSVVERSSPVVVVITWPIVRAEGACCEQRLLGVCHCRCTFPDSEQKNNARRFQLLVCIRAKDVSQSMWL